MQTPRNIDEVITSLDAIIRETEERNDPLGYFAALYRKVTLKVKEGIENNYFDDGPRMEKLDVVFAQRYLRAYHAYQKKEFVTDSWLRAFAFSTQYWPIVFQHLLTGMNAHINLDLGVAAAEVAGRAPIENLKSDFDRINEILSSLVGEVQNNLAGIWPTLTFILRTAGKFDDILVDFSMKKARDGAWKFACSLVEYPETEWAVCIEERDRKIAEVADLIIRPGLIVRLAFGIIRLGERGTVAQRIKTLHSQAEPSFHPLART